MAKGFDFRHAPGHLIRRAHQVAIFMEETADFDVTPVQFAILNALLDDPGEDQVTPPGIAAAQKMKRLVVRVQQRILQPLEGADREQLIALLDRLVADREGLAAAE